MSININKLFVLFLFPLLLFGCSQKSKYTDLSNLPVRKKKEVVNKNKVDKFNSNSNNNEFIKDLLPLQDSQQLLSKFKFGKKDPFSEEVIQLNTFHSGFKLTGFITTESNKYVLVNYLDNQGTIDEESIGGVNTYLLPNGAKVINIDPTNKQLTILHENENLYLNY